MAEPSEPSSDWETPPMFLRTEVDEELLQRSPALRGIQALLYDRPPLELQATYRTQGNNFMKQAQGANISDSERREALSSAYECYTSALNVELGEGGRGAGNSALSVIYANRAESFRQLGNYSLAFADADRAERLDALNYKALIRKAKICEDLDDFARAVYYWKRCWEATFKDQVRQQLDSARARLKEQEGILSEGLKAAKDALKDCPVFRYGKALPWIQLTQQDIIESFRNGVTLFLINQTARSVDRIKNCDPALPLKTFCDIAGVASLQFAPNWTDEFSGGKLAPNFSAKYNAKSSKDSEDLKNDGTSVSGGGKGGKNSASGGIEGGHAAKDAAKDTKDETKDGKDCKDKDGKDKDGKDSKDRATAAAPEAPAAPTISKTAPTMSKTAAPAPANVNINLDLSVCAAVCLPGYVVPGVISFFAE